MDDKQKLMRIQLTEVQVRRNKNAEMLKNTVLVESISINTNGNQQINEGLEQIAEAPTSALANANSKKSKILCGICRRLGETRSLPKELRGLRDEQNNDGTRSCKHRKDGTAAVLRQAAT